MSKKALIIGAGITGAVIAERLASSGFVVDIVEKRGYVAGNCYDYVDSNNLTVPRYGPHFFHTNDKSVWDYLSRFTEWVSYHHRVLSSVDGKKVPVPVNITTVNALFGLDLKSSEEMEKWLEENIEKFDCPKNSEELAVSRVGRVLYEKLFKNYTIKQWEKSPSELSPEVCGRIPVRTDFEDRYFTDEYQAMPKYGFTKMIEAILNKPGIFVSLNTEYEPGVSDRYEVIVNTGPIDEFFDNVFGKLSYRSLRFYHLTEILYNACGTFQEAATINYPNEHAYTRVTEPKFATGEVSLKTTLIYEFPEADGEPYYPVPTANKDEAVKRYLNAAEAAEEHGIYCAGRLGKYRYLDMSTAVKEALDLAEKIVLKHVV